MKLPRFPKIKIVWNNEKESLFDVRLRLHKRKAALTLLAGMAWFVSLLNDPSSIYAFDPLQWGIVAGCTMLLMWLASTNAHSAFLDNPSDKTGDAKGTDNAKTTDASSGGSTP